MPSDDLNATIARVTPDLLSGDTAIWSGDDMRN
jgi:hypothetical protein